VAVAVAVTLTTTTMVAAATVVGVTSTVLEATMVVTATVTTMLDTRTTCTVHHPKDQQNLEIIMIVTMVYFMKSVTNAPVLVADIMVVRV